MEIKASSLPAVQMDNGDIQSLKVRTHSAEKKTAAAKKVAREFETMFVGMMLKSMRETVGKDKLTGGGHGEEVYQSLLDQEYARAVADNGGIGLARIIEKQLVTGGEGKKPTNRD